MADEPPIAAVTGQSHYVAVQLGGCELFIPQPDLCTLEPLADVDTSAPPPGAVGTIRFGEETLPVYCLAPALDGLYRQPGAQRICAILRVAGYYYGLLCAEAALLPEGGLDIRPLPAAMQRAESPLLGLAVHDGAVVCASSAAALLQVIQGLRPQQSD